MTAARAVSDYELAGQGNGYINATSTCDCGFRADFAGESARVLMDAGAKIARDQRLVA